MLDVKWVALAALVMVAGCKSKQEKCEQAKAAWLADSWADVADSLSTIKSDKDRALVKVGAKEEIDFEEAAYLDHCVSRSDADLACLLKGPPSKFYRDPACGKAVSGMRDELSKAFDSRPRKEEPPAASAAPGDAGEKTGPVRYDIAKLDWDALPRWNSQLQLSAEIPTMSGPEDVNCPEVYEAEAKHRSGPTPKDEFERKEAEDAQKKDVDAAYKRCWERVKKEAQPIPQLAIVSIDAVGFGEFNFEGKYYWVALGRGSAEWTQLNPKKEPFAPGEIHDIQGAEGENVLVLEIANDGIVLEPAPKDIGTTIQMHVDSIERAKKLRPLLKKLSHFEIVFEPGDPKKGTGLFLERHSDNRMMNALMAMEEKKPMLGLRGRPIASRLVQGDEVLMGPTDLQQ